jgi:hypothetical protein
MTSKKLLVILGHAFVGWALCAATMEVGMATTSMNNTLIIHAIAVPIFFWGSGMELLFRVRVHVTLNHRVDLCRVCNGN